MLVGVFDMHNVSWWTTLVLGKIDANLKVSLLWLPISPHPLVETEPLRALLTSPGSV